MWVKQKTIDRLIDWSWKESRPLWSSRPLSTSQGRIGLALCHSALIVLVLVLVLVSQFGGGTAVPIPVPSAQTGTDFGIFWFERRIAEIDNFNDVFGKSRGKLLKFCRHISNYIRIQRLDIIRVRIRFAFSEALILTFRLFFEVIEKNKKFKANSMPFKVQLFYPINTTKVQNLTNFELRFESFLNCFRIKDSLG